MKSFSSKLRLNLAWHCTGALIFLDFSWFVKLHTFGKMVPQFAYLSIGSFLYERLSCPYNQNHKEHFCFDVIMAFLSR